MYYRAKVTNFAAMLPIIMKVDYNIVNDGNGDQWAEVASEEVAECLENINELIGEIRK